MSDDPWAAFSPQAGADPWADFAPSKPQNWSDAPGNVGSDIVKTAGEMKDAVVGLSRGTVKATAKALTDPAGLARDVVSGAGDLVSGAAKGVADYGKHFVEGFTDPEKERARLQAQADERKQHAIERPLSTLANIASQGTIGKATLGRTLLSGTTKTADAINTIGGKVPAGLVREGLGLTSGLPAEAQRLATEAGTRGGDAAASFNANIKNPDRVGLVNRAGDALDEFSKDIGRNYLKNKVGWANPDQYLDGGKVKTALDDARAAQSFGGVADNGSVDGALNEAQKIITRRLNRPVPLNTPAASAPGPAARGSFPSLWSSPAARVIPETLPTATEGGGAVNATPVVRIPARANGPDAALSSWVNQPRPEGHGPSMTGAVPSERGVQGPSPSPHYTPEGFDKLKQELDTLMYDRNIAPEGTKARAAVGKVAGAVRDQLRTEVPGYAHAMDVAAPAIEARNEARGALSLGEKSRSDAALGKLLSTMRTDVSAANGARGDSLNRLAKYDPTLPHAIAGQAANAVFPRGVVARGGALLHAGVMGGAAAFLPQLLAAMPLLAAASPRAVGNANYALGAAHRGARAIGATHENIGKAIEALRLLSQKNDAQ